MMDGEADAEFWRRNTNSTMGKILERSIKAYHETTFRENWYRMLFHWYRQQKALQI